MLLRIFVMLSLIVTAAGLGALGMQMLTPPPQVSPTLAEAPPPPPPPARARMLVAARALPAGTLLKEDDFIIREVPPGQLPENAVVPTEEARVELRGAMLRQFMEAGAPLERALYLRPRDRGFLAAVLGPGKRAISVGVDAVTGTAGLIWPGDQVDLILTQELAANDAPISRRVVGETLLTDLRVIAVDQQITQGATGSTDPTLTRIARTVTLEVSAAQAERVAVGSRLGRIAIAVRSIEDSVAAVKPSAPALFASDVSPALTQAGLSSGARMRVIQGDETRSVTFR